MIWVNSMGLGDCWWHILFLKKLGGIHTLHCREDNHEWLRQLVGTSPIEIAGMTLIPPEAIDCWIGTQHGNSWHANLCPNDMIGYLVNWFRGWGCADFQRNDLLSPSIGKRIHHVCEILFIDSDPRSGQCPEYNADEMEALKKEFKRRNCLSVKNQGWSLSAISQIAYNAKYIIGVATGTLWPCLQKETLNTQKYLILEPIRLQFDGGKEISHHRNVSSLRDQLVKDGIL